MGSQKKLAPAAPGIDRREVEMMAAMMIAAAQTAEATKRPVSDTGRVNSRAVVADIASLLISCSNGIRLLFRLD
jgi:hypothetical protein